MDNNDAPTYGEQKTSARCASIATQLVISPVTAVDELIITPIIMHLAIRLPIREILTTAAPPTHAALQMIHKHLKTTAADHPRRTPDVADQCHPSTTQPQRRRRRQTKEGSLCCHRRSGCTATSCRKSSFHWTDDTQRLYCRTNIRRFDRHRSRQIMHIRQCLPPLT